MTLRFEEAGRANRCLPVLAGLPGHFSPPPKPPCAPRATPSPPRHTLKRPIHRRGRGRPRTVRASRRGTPAAHGFLMDPRDAHARRRPLAGADRTAPRSTAPPPVHGSQRAPPRAAPAAAPRHATPVPPQRGPHRSHLPAPAPRRTRVEHPPHDLSPAWLSDGALLGDAVHEVIEAVGESARQRVALAEDRLVMRVRAAGMWGAGAAAAGLFALAAWVCGAVALAWWLIGPLRGPAALAVVAGLHAVLALVVFVTAGTVARRSRRSAP